MKKAFFLFLLAGMSLHTAFAQWQTYDSGLPDDEILQFISAPSPNVVWGNSATNLDYNYYPSMHFARTIDGGVTWNTGDINSVESEITTAIFALDAMTAWAGRFDFNNGAGSLWKTSDGGATWSDQNLPLADPYGWVDVIYFWDARNGILVGDPDSEGYFEIYTTRDGGANWRRTPAADIPAIAHPSEFGLSHGFDVHGANTLWFTSSFGRVFKTTDRGLTWTAAETPYITNDSTAYNITAVAFSDERNGLAVSNANPFAFPGSVEPKIIRTTDGGATWTMLTNSNSNEYTEKGLLLAIPGADRTYFVGEYNQAVGYSYNAGESWTWDPTIAGVGGKFFDPKTGWLSTFYIGGTGGEILKFTGNLSPSTTRKVTLQLDLTGTLVSPAGVHLATSLNGWSPSATPMTSMGNGYYEATIEVAAGTTFRYKFINGDSWGQNESVPSGCGSLNSGGAYDRSYTVGQWDARLPVVCFGSCMGCGDTAPAGAFYCPGGSLQCEIFDWYDAGALANSNWAGSGAAVTGYYHGYTNYSGGRALHVGAGANAIYKLGNRHGGPYEITMKVYVPRDREAYLSLLTDQDNPASSVFNFALEANSTAWDDDGTYKAYAQNDWLDLKIVANLTTGDVAVSLNGQVVHHDSHPLLTQLGAIAFSAPSKHTEFLVDDIGLKSQGANKPNLLIAGGSNGASEAYPNPANGTLFVPFDFEASGELELTLTDAQGRMALLWSVPEAQAGVEELDLAGLAPGVYFLKMKHPEGERSERVVIK